MNVSDSLPPLHRAGKSRRSALCHVGLPSGGGLAVPRCAVLPMAVLRCGAVGRRGAPLQRPFAEPRGICPASHKGGPAARGEGFGSGEIGAVKS